MRQRKKINNSYKPEGRLPLYKKNEKIRFEHSTVFNTSANIIVNTVNCVGVMGAGIALEFKLRYPEMYADYKNRCNNGKLKVCNTYIFSYNDINILNFPTKGHWRYPSKIDWIDKGLANLVHEIILKKGYYKDIKIKSIAFPKLGAGKGGLDWEVVKPIMEKHLNKLLRQGIRVYICLDDEQEAKGIEESMLKIVKNLDIDELKKIGLSKKQCEILKESSKEIKRFWHISNKLTSTSYENLFKYCYKECEEYNKKIEKEQERKEEQMSWEFIINNKNNI